MPIPDIPGYVLGAALGRGGSGDVWSAVRLRDRLPCAVKLIAVDADGLEQAVRESAVLQQVSHEHVLDLIEVMRVGSGPDSEALALVLQLADGGSLADVVAGRGHLSLGEVVTAVSPVAAAMADVHGQGVVHADLSPGNVLFTRDGRPMVSDLGVARIAGEVAGPSYGTDGFLAPEVLDGELPTPASDAYSIGALAWFGLTGAAPVPGAIRRPLSELAPGVPHEVVDVITRALAGVPSARPTCAELALTLFEAAPAEPVALAAGHDPSMGITYRIRSSAAATGHATGHEGGRAARQPGSRAVLAARAPGQRKALVVAAVSVALLGGATGVGARWWQHRGEQPGSAALVQAPPGSAALVQAPPTRPGRPTTTARSTATAVPAPMGSPTRTTAGTSTPPTAAPVRTPAAPAEAGSRSVVLDRSAVRETPAEVLGALVDARARAWRTGTSSVLTQAHAAGSPAWRRDRADLSAVARARAHYEGLRFTVRGARLVSTAGDVARLTARVDRSAYDVVRTGERLRSPPARGERDTAFELRWTDDGWRIQDWS